MPPLKLRCGTVSMGLKRNEGVRNDALVWYSAPSDAGARNRRLPDTSASR